MVCTVCACLCSDDEIKIGKDEGKAHFEQVKLRDKKRPQHDPFADLLSPKANARLRWSQELNPLYDIIKGFKISDGVKLYDTPSKLLESTRASNLIGSHSERASYKSPSVIVEDEGEYDPIDQRTSPSESVPYSPPGETSRPTSSFSEDTSLSPTHYARKQHLYEDITILQDPKEELHHPAPPQLKGTSLIYHMKRSVTQPADAKKHGTCPCLYCMSSCIILPLYVSMMFVLVYTCAACLLVCIRIHVLFVLVCMSVYCLCLFVQGMCVSVLCSSVYSMFNSVFLWLNSRVYISWSCRCRCACSHSEPWFPGGPSPGTYWAESSYREEGAPAAAA